MGKISRYDVGRMLVDTGSTQTVVHGRWIPMMHSPAVRRPSALCWTADDTAHLNSPDHLGWHRVDWGSCVHKDLCYNALLGRDISAIRKLADEFGRPEQILAV